MSEIFEQLSTCVLEGDAEKAEALTKKALEDGLSANEILNKGLVVGMAEVSARFKRGDMFVPEVLMSAEAMHAGQEILRPLLAESGADRVGTILLGTVKGDLHDIGKNLVGMMCEGSGFEVIDLGFNVDPEVFVQAIKEHQPDIVGMSAMLTTTMRAMGYTIKAIEEAGLRDKVKVIVGGAPVDEEFSQRIGADGYGSNAVSGPELARTLLGKS
ncbi:MAG TPA: corrinoid protein [Anaerolineales bacterium]|jgi:5-methyltetrahydrofolate--homocysteine methyltransferase|nr:corrinoid protein [Anaerolineales bacterium]